MNTATVLAILGALALGLIAARTYAVRRQRRARAEYQRVLQQALEDGVLTPDEMAALDSVRTAGALSPADTRTAALAIYRVALRDAAADARLTADEDEALRRLQDQLGLSEQDLGADFIQLSRLRLLARVAAGSLPVVHSPVPLVPDERCHWVVQATIAERIQLAGAARRDAAGIGFDVLAPDPFAAAGRRDPLRPAPDILPSDVGALIVTSRRTIFQGARRTITVPHARADRVTLHADGIRLDEITRAGARFFLVDDPELACAILLQAARRRRAEIRPARTSLIA
jgi:hypothetical protein